MTTLLFENAVVSNTEGLGHPGFQVLVKLVSLILGSDEVLADTQQADRVFTDAFLQQRIAHDTELMPVCLGQHDRIQATKAARSIYDPFNYQYSRSKRIDAIYNNVYPDRSDYQI